MWPHHCWRVFAALLLCGPLVACQGTIGDPGEEPGVRTRPDDQPAGVGRTGSADGICAETGIVAAASPFSRLTRVEYNNTVRDLLGTTDTPAESFPDTVSGGVGFEVGVAPVTYELYSNAANDLAVEAVVDLSTIHDCDVSGLGEDECGRRFIEDFGLKAFRRPVPADVRDRLLTVFGVGVTENGYDNGIRLTLQAMLQSPYFLYKGEFDIVEPVAGDIVPLSDYERASRLSYLIWGSMPDDALFAAAAAGELGTVEQMAAQAQRMLDDPRAREPVKHLFTQWLQLELEQEVVTGLPEGVPAMMQAETERFVENLLFEESGGLEELLTANYSFINEPLAEVYGIEGVTGNDLQRVDLDPTQRAGVLTHPSFLTSTASEGSAAPVFRGLFVRQELFCQLLPEPPNEIPPFSESGGPTDSLRDRLAQHRENQACAGCHALMDPIGFGFESYDSAGRYRTDGPGGEIDASGDVVGTNESDGEFYGAVELTQRLATSEDVRQCMANQFLRRGLARLEGTEDVCSLRRMDESFAAADYDLLQLLVAVSRTDAFLYRRLGEGEGR